MGFFKKIKSAVTDKIKAEALSPEIKQKMEQSVLSQIDTYESDYREEYQVVVREWSEEGKTIVFKEVDRETHNRVGVETLKDKIGEIVWDELEDDVEEHIKQQTDNELAMKAAKKAGEKAVEKFVDKLVDEGLEKISKKSEDEHDTKSGE